MSALARMCNSLKTLEIVDLRQTLQLTKIGVVLPFGALPPDEMGALVLETSYVGGGYLKPKCTSEGTQQRWRTFKLNHRLYHRKVVGADPLSTTPWRDPASSCQKGGGQGRRLLAAPSPESESGQAKMVKHKRSQDGF